jgi:hypothetical protein
MRWIVIIIPFLLVCSLFGQNEQREQFSINPKIGMQYDINTGIGYTYGLAINYFSKKTIYSTAYYYTKEIRILGKAKPEETLNDFNLMLGRYFGARFLRIEGQFGLSFLWGQNRGEKYYQFNHDYQYESEKFTTIGFPLKIGFKYMPFEFMSVGLDLQANLNVVKSFFISFLSLEIGIVRKEIKSRPID